MAHTKFKVRDSIIYVVLYVNDKCRPERSTGIKIDPRYFIDSRVAGREADKVNGELKRLEDDLPNLADENPHATTSMLGELMERVIKNETITEPEIHVEKKSTDLTLWVNEFIAKCRKFKLFTKGTIDTYEQTLFLLVEYAKISNINLTFQAITLDFYYGFTTYLYDTIVHQDNTVGKHVKNLKKFMQDSFDDDMHENIAFKKKKFKKPVFVGENVALSTNEVVNIYSLDLSIDAQLSLHRDLFVFNCWTGVRFGDLCKIRPEQVRQMSDGKYLQLITEKTGEDVIIPFHPLAEAIYSFYNYRLPDLKRSENVVFNRHIKTICERAGIKTRSRYVTSVRGIKTEHFCEKWELISAHTARRSFATNCYLSGIPTLTIMAITGHKTEKAFLRYICVTKEEHAKRMMQHFNSAPIVSVMRKIS